MQVISIFSGIGGFEIASEWIGWDNIVSCEINPFGQRVLKYYWPNSYHHENVKTLTYEIIKAKSRYNESEPTIIVGGFPCQPFSAAGKRLGTEDDRHLWPECIRLVREIQPEWCVFENVSGLVNWNGGMVFNEVQADLEAEGYEVTPFLLPACGVNAPHKRERVWFVARKSDADADADTTSNAITGQNRESIEIKGTGIAVNEQIGRGQFQAVQHNRLDDLPRSTSGPRLQRPEINEKQTAGIEQCDESGIITNTTVQQSERMRSEQREFSEQEQGEFRGNGCSMGSGDVADTDDNGLQRSKINGSVRKIRQEREQQFIRPIPSTWQNFPTQSPVCSGNNGIPSGLVGITFPKFRNESIKAYGNAIVPQVVLQIFKAIEQFNTKNHDNTD